MTAAKRQRQSATMAPPLAPPEAPGEAMFCGMPMKWVSLVSLTLQTTWQVFIIKLARMQQTHYLNSSTILCAEVLKTITSLAMEAYTKESVQIATSSLWTMVCTAPLETCKYGVPALLYCIQNNLLFYSLEKLSMAVQQVTYQMKIFTAAFFSVLMLGKHIKPVQWVAICLLIVGVMLVNVPSDAIVRLVGGGRADHPGEASDSTAFMDSDVFLGVGAVLIACMCSGAAGVFMEKMLKQSEGSLWFKNVLLGSFGSISAFATALGKDYEVIMRDGFFVGFTWRVQLVIWTIACGGLLAACVIKYADNILRQFSTASSLLLTSTLSALVLQDVVLGMTFCTGSITVIGATFMYNLGLPQWLSQPHFKIAHPILCMTTVGIGTPLICSLATRKCIMRVFEGQLAYVQQISGSEQNR